MQSLFAKWGFANDMWFERFRYEEHCPMPDGAKHLLLCFLKSPSARGVLSQTGVGIFSPDKLEVLVEELSTNVTHMTFFNKLEEVGAISHTGHIRGRIEETFDDIPIVNLVREVFFLEESELYDAFSDRDRREFLFRIFQHVNLGGASNQYEDHVEKYFKATKVIYKDLLSVRKNESGDTEVMSKVYLLRSLGPGGHLYKVNHTSNFTYLIVDPMSRSVVVWRFQYRPIW